MKFRNLRIQNLIRDELALLIERELEFPDMLVTLTEVVVDDKFDHAKVKVGILPEAKAPQAMSILKERQGELQHLLLRKLNVKPMPRIAFEHDKGQGNAARVEKLLLDE